MNGRNNETPRGQRRQTVAEIVSIGDEISTGAILDTNSQFLSQSLSEIGVRTLYHSTVGDDMDAMVEAFAVAFRRADVVVITGGLGPTQDDLTRQAAAKVLGVELEFDQASLEHMTSLFTRRGRKPPESNNIQAYFPKGSKIIFNPHGTAPGFIIEQSRENLPNSPSCVSGYADRKGDFIALTFPGVPAEMKEMWAGPDGRDAVLRFVNRISGGKETVYRNKLIHTFGAGESSVEEKLGDLISRDHFPRVGITAKNSVITLRIFAEGASEEECKRQIDDVSNTIYANVGEFVFGEDGETFADVIAHNLRAQCRKVGLFEWGTRGILASILDSDVVAFGRVFGGAERQDFIRLFGDSSAVPEERRKIYENRETFGASYCVLEDKLSDELLSLCRSESRGQTVDYLVAVGPYPAEYDSTDKDKTVDVAFVDLRDQDNPLLRRDTFIYGGHPAIIDALFCNRALDMLRKYQ